MSDSAAPTRTPWWPLVLAVSVTVACHLYASPFGEPFKNNDETRHVMTGVFYRDALFDLPASARDPKGYAVRYYVQYPALGLLVWPPFFHIVEGAAMAVFGTSYATARVVLSLFALLGAVYLYRLVLRTHDSRVAGLTAALCGLAPVVFDHSRYVLLDVPTLALVLGSVFHFERYLGEQRPGDAYLACLLAALAALTRFNGVMLLPYVLIRLAMTGNFRLAFKKPVLIGIGLALVLTVPYYAFTWREYQAGIETAAVTGTNVERTGFFDARNFWLYPSYVPEQLGWFATPFVFAGLVLALRRDRRAAGPYLGLLAATYITCVPFAEPAPRHAIYWVPALALFITMAVIELVKWDRIAGLLAAAAVVTMTALSATWTPGYSVRGYEDTAQHVVAQRTTERPVMFEGVLAGGFVYQVRRADPDRRVWVLRGDKVLYAVHSDPHGGYVEFAATEAEVLAVLHKYDPEFIVVEEPQLLFDLPAAAKLREVLPKHPDRFRLVHTVHLVSNHHEFGKARLEIWRKLDRNPDAARSVDLPVLGLGRTLGVQK